MKNAEKIYEMRKSKVINKEIISKLIHEKAYYAFLILTHLENKITNEHREECMKKICERSEYLCEVYHTIANKKEKEILWQKIISSFDAIEIYLSNYTVESDEKKNQLLNILFKSRAYSILVKSLSSRFLNKEQVYKLIDLIIKEKDIEAAYLAILYTNKLEIDLSEEIIINLIDVISKDKIEFKNLITYQLIFLYKFNDYIVKKILEQNDCELAFIFKTKNNNYNEQLSPLLMMKNLTD